jgi:cyanophycin synthetase
VVVEPIDGVETITLRVGDRASFPIVPVAALPSTFQGVARMNVENAVAAGAAALALDVRLDDIRHGPRTFTTAFHTAPGRLNVVDSDGIRVIIDYGHNAAAMRALGRFVDRFVKEVPSVDRLVEDSPFAFCHAGLRSSVRRATVATRSYTCKYPFCVNAIPSSAT